MTENDSEADVSSGLLLIYWKPAEADVQRGNTRERLNAVTSVEIVPAPHSPDLHAQFEDGVGYFDMDEIRGWRTEGEVEVQVGSDTSQRGETPHRLAKAEPKHQRGDTE